MKVIDIAKCIKTSVIRSSYRNCLTCIRGGLKRTLPSDPHSFRTKRTTDLHRVSRHKDQVLISGWRDTPSFLSYLFRGNVWILSAYASLDNIVLCKSISNDKQWVITYIFSTNFIFKNNYRQDRMKFNYKSKNKNNHFFCISYIIFNCKWGKQDNIICIQLPPS